MSYQVLFRKYRPKRFEELVYQNHISEVLRNAIKQKKVGHAYIFSGPRGVGKTTTARILAKALNCTGNTDDPPCNQCKNCIEIDEGRSLDVIEIDAASNRGIDHIRDLRESVKFAPTSSKYKVYIIDEAHMLTNESFNALLKTLEEPPPYVIFVLATTDVHKIPETIISRCQRFNFHKIPQDVIKEELKKILNKEHIEFDEESLDLISKMADGALRDALSILEQIIAIDEKKISIENTRKILGIPQESYSIELIKSIIEGDTRKAIEIADEVAKKESDLMLWLAYTSEIIRDIIVFGKKGFEGIDKLYFIDLLDELIKTINMAKYFENPKLLVDLFIMKASYKSKIPPIEEILKYIKEGKEIEIHTAKEERRGSKTKTFKDKLIEKLKTKNKHIAESIIKAEVKENTIHILLKSVIKTYYQFMKNKYDKIILELSKEILEENVSSIKVEFESSKKDHKEVIEDFASLFQGKVVKKLETKK